FSGRGTGSAAAGGVAADDFYRHQSFDDSRFYGARRGGVVGERSVERAPGGLGNSDPLRAGSGDVERSPGGLGNIDPNLRDI
ncbi:MAG TPA: hypothetical protein VFQ39_12165, partial [Longimicrobium sp.]|nr:hypothetical protein [Longimicrobium sp.]